MPNRSDFQLKLNELFRSFEGHGLSFADIAAGDLHRLVGGYPGPDHRMPVCCDVMYGEMTDDDKVLESPPKGKGANLVIRYCLPR